MILTFLLKSLKTFGVKFVALMIINIKLIVNSIEWTVIQTFTVLKDKKCREAYPCVLMRSRYTSSYYYLIIKYAYL